MEYKVTGAREALEKPKFGQGGTHESGKPGGGGYWWIIFFVAAAIIVANQVKKENPDLTEGYITTAEQLHLKTYFTRPEAIKEGCRLFLPPGNSAGMPQQDWRKLLKELQ